MNENKEIAKLSAVTISANMLLAGFKLYAGIAGRSSAMLSDAVHSLSDVFTTIVAFIGVHASRKPADREHPYGHDRLECIASAFLGALLLATGLGIGAAGVRSILSPDPSGPVIPGPVALVAAAFSIVLKEAMYWYTRYYAKKLNSGAFMADAWHHRSDALSSVGSLIGIGGAMLGFPVLDPIASVGICLCVLKVGWDILKDAVDKMLDSSCSEAFEAELKQLICAQTGVLGLDMLQTRQFGSRIYVDAEISVNGDLSLTEAHHIAEHVHTVVERAYPQVGHIMIHENPHRGS